MAILRTSSGLVDLSAAFINSGTKSSRTLFENQLPNYFVNQFTCEYTPLHYCVDYRTELCSTFAKCLLSSQNRMSR